MVALGPGTEHEWLGLTTAGGARGLTFPGKKTRCGTFATRCRRPSPTARGKRSPSLPIRVMSARSTFSSRPRPGCFSSRSRATPAGLSIRVERGYFTQDDHVRGIENPLHLTNRKCQELKSQLGWAAGKLGIRTRLPFIQAAVFLSAPDLRCDFDEVQRTMVFGRDGLTEQSGLPGIWAGLLGQPPRSASSRVDPALSRQMEKLLQKIGVRGLRKQRKIGPFQLAPRAFDTGPTWEDYLAENPALPGDQVRRIRIYLSDLNAPKTERDSVWRAARREYLALQGISHQGIVQAEQFSEEHEAGPAIIFRHGATWRRLDQFMAEQAAGGAAGAGGTRQNVGLPIETRIEMVRQLAEALDHAHRRHLYHRALAARSVYVEMDGRYPRLRICDWQVAARPGAGSSVRTPCWRPGRQPLWPRTSIPRPAPTSPRNSAIRGPMQPSSTSSVSAR